MMSNTPNTSDRNAPITTSEPSTISIWQQNINKSHICQHDLISSAILAKKGIDLIALQEPSINNFGNTIASRDWSPVYPTTHGKEPHKTCSVLLIRNNLLTENSKQLDFPSGDVTVVKLNGTWGELTIYNIYNDCNSNDTVHLLKRFNRDHASPSEPMAERASYTIWLRDFNRHHPHWDDPTDTRLFTRSALNNTEILISVVAEAGLNMALPSSIPTHFHNISKRWTRLDQVFISEEALDMIITCEALKNVPGINTNHLPILTTLDLNLARAPSSSPKNFRNVD